jgi:hypothetical protein
MATRRPLLAVMLALTLAAQARPLRAQGVAIDHGGVGCLVAGVFPRLDACFAPEDALARARVHFRARGTVPWYYVDFSAAGGCRSVLLPKPLPTIPGVDYYVTAVDRAFAETRTRDHSPRVVRQEGDCDRGLLIAAGSATGVVLLGALASGAPAVPAGFSPEGIVSAPAEGGGPTSQAKAGGGGGGVGVLLGLGALGAGGYFLYKELQDDSSEPDPSIDGDWQGSTSQNQPVAFTVAGSSLTRFRTTVQVPVGSTVTLLPIDRAFSPGLALSGGTFSFQQPSEPPLTVTGTLDPSGSASGRIDLGGRVIASWQASRR